MPRMGCNAPVVEFASDHVKVEWGRPILAVVSRMLPRSLISLILLGFLFNLTIVLIFAGLFTACSEDCFNDIDDFTFQEMFSLSVQTFTTVGYGGIYPTCTGGQLLVLFETYTALMAQLVLGALVLIKVLEPHAKIRFATSVLVSKCGDGWQLQVRAANQSRYALEHGKAELRVLFQDSTGVYTQLSAALVADAKSFIQAGEPWNLQHIFDATSPVQNAMSADQDGDGLLSDEEVHEMLTQVFAIDVSLSFVDPLYGAKVRFQRRYHLRDVVTHAQWDDMLRREVLSERVDGSAERVRLIFDHAVLDSFTETPPSPALLPSPARRDAAARTAAKEANAAAEGTV